MMSDKVDPRAMAWVEDFDRLQSERQQNWDATWQKVADLCLPNRNFTVQTAKGEQRHHRILDSIGVWANDKFASGLSSFLTSPTLIWFHLVVNDEEAMKKPAVQKWLNIVRDRMMELFNSTEANFYPNAHEMYLDLGAFGTGCMFVGQENGKIVFITRPLHMVYLRENRAGQVDTVYLLLKLTARQAVQEYGKENLPENILKAAKDEPDTTFEFIQCVRPNSDYIPGKSQYKAKDKRWTSVHIYRDKRMIVRESGFDDFPFLVPRWTKVAGENYGRSAGMSALPDLRLAQAMKKTLLTAVEAMVDPTTLIPDDGFLTPFKRRPGGLVYFRAGMLSPSDVQQLHPQGRPDFGMEMLRQVHEHITRTFYVDQLQNLLMREAKTPPTATEVMQRREEVLRTMAPQIARMHNEFLGPLISRVYTIMARMGMLPPPPPEIDRLEMTPEFVSPAFLAQRASEVDNIVRFVQLVAPIIEQNPEEGQAMMQTEAQIRRVAKLLNIDPDALTTPEQMKKWRKQKAEQMAQQQQIAIAQMGGEAAQSVGQGGQELRKAVKDEA